eukprot:5888520-Prorocentrum_lima.AAC.1
MVPDLTIPSFDKIRGGVIRTTLLSSMGAFRKAVLMSVVVMVSTRTLVRLRTILRNPMSAFCVEAETR